MPVEIFHGCDAGVARVAIVEVVQPLALLPVPKAKTDRTQTRQSEGLTSCIGVARVSCLVKPDAILVSYSYAGVERVELDDRGNAGIAIDEYLIVQPRNTWKKGMRADDMR